MKTFKCNCGRDILVDDDVNPIVFTMSWNCDSGRTSVRHSMFQSEKPILNLSTVALGEPQAGMMIDHKDLNTHNNQSSNLRFCTKQQNSWNRGVRKGSRSGYKGVAIDRHCAQQFRAYIDNKGKKLTIGRYETPEQAARAYNEKAKELFGEFAYLNDV